jgi:hypothetical protein
MERVSFIFTATTPFETIREGVFIQEEPVSATDAGCSGED